MDINIFIYLYLYLFLYLYRVFSVLEITVPYFGFVLRYELPKSPYFMRISSLSEK